MADGKESGDKEAGDKESGNKEAGDKEAGDKKDGPPRNRPRTRGEPSGSCAEPGAAAGSERSRRRDGSGGLSVAEAVRRAVRQVAELTGRDPESVVAIERAEHGWWIGMEVVETRRIPDSADILAMYETELDWTGELVSYRRVRRYSRGRLHEEPQ